MVEFARSAMRGRLGRSSVAVSLGLIAASALAACGSGSSTASSTASTGSSSTKGGPSGSPVVMHAVLSVTGPDAFLGDSEANALKVLEKHVNATGGIDGHPLQVDIADNESTAATSVSLATNWISQGVPFMLNGSVGAIDKAVDALATPNGPFIYDLSPVEHPSPGSMIFSSSFSLKQEVQADLNFFKSRGWTNIAVMSSTDASGVGGFAQIQAVLAEPNYSSMHLVSHETFNTSDVNVTTQLSVIKAAKPQAMIIWTTGTPLGTVLNGMSSLGLENLPSIADSGNDSVTEMVHFGAVVPKDLYIPNSSLSLPPSDLPSGPVQSTVASFQKLLAAAGDQPTLGAGQTWDAASLLIGALKKIGVNATAKQILAYMQNLHNVPGVFGMYNTSFSNHRGLSTSDVYLSSWDGKKSVLASGPGGAPLSSSAG